MNDYKKGKMMPTPMQRIAKKTKIFSDLKLFRVIYYLYINRYIQTSDFDPLNKVMVPIDIDKIAQNIGTDPELVFSRLYVFLNSLYDKPSWNPKIRFFLHVDSNLNRINFGYMCSIMAKQEEENKRYKLSLCLSIISLVVSAIALIC